MQSIDFTTIDYLQTGTAKQQQLYTLLKQSRLLEILQMYEPLVVGTIPLGIEVEGSDVDVILYCTNFTDLISELERYYKHYDDFQLTLKSLTVLVCRFTIDSFPIEIYATCQPTYLQYGYLHMVKEYQILQIEGQEFKQQIIALKKAGYKTEPAFCHVLQLDGDPYQALLVYEPSSRMKQD
jgi:hypothetical protein